MTMQKGWLFAAVGAAMLVLAGFGSEVDLEANHKAAVDSPTRSQADQDRDATSKPLEIMKFLEIRPGMVIGDVFAGGGYYSELMAKAVGPDGRVYLQNNQAWLAFTGKQLEARLKDSRLPNVVRLDSEIPDLKLPEGELDLVLMVMTFHDLYYTTDGWPEVDQDHFLAQIFKSLKPGGAFAIIDHMAEPGSGHRFTQELHRIDKEFVRDVVVKAGFRFEAESNVLNNGDDDHSLLVFDEKIRRKTDRFVFRFRKPEPGR